MSFIVESLMSNQIIEIIETASNVRGIIFSCITHSTHDTQVTSVHYYCELGLTRFTFYCRYSMWECWRFFMLSKDLIILICPTIVYKMKQLYTLYVLLLYCLFLFINEVFLLCLEQWNNDTC